MKIYLVVFDWSTEDDSYVETYPYSTYQKAVDKFNEIIRLEKDSRCSWAADAFDKDGNIRNGYEFDYLAPNNEQETQCYWCLTNKNDWYAHDFLSVRTLEVE